MCALIGGAAAVGFAFAAGAGSGLGILAGAAAGFSLLVSLRFDSAGAAAFVADGAAVLAAGFFAGAAVLGAAFFVVVFVAIIKS
jgi:hypothetical protein